MEGGEKEKAKHTPNPTESKVGFHSLKRQKKAIVWAYALGKATYKSNQQNWIEV